MISPSKKGSKSELIACVWLLDQGYEVFRSVSADGIGDIVIFKDGAFTIIDIKTITIRNERNHKYCTPLSQKQISLGVRLLVVCPDTGECTLLDPGTTKYYQYVKQSKP